MISLVMAREKEIVQTYIFNMGVVGIIIKSFEYKRINWKI